MSKEYYPLEDLDSSNTPFLEAPATHPVKNREKRSILSFFVRQRLFTLSLVGILSTNFIWRTFHGPFSTLWVYLSVVLVILPISILQDLPSLLDEAHPSIRSRTDLKAWWNKNRTVWIQLELFGLFLWLLSSFSLFTFFPFQNFPSNPSLSKIPSQQRYFIAANLYQSEEILPNWIKQVSDLTETLGRENVFISIYESNSKDATKQMLRDFDQQLEAKGIKHKILSDNFGKHYGNLESNANSDRIKMLSAYRNKAQTAFYEESDLSSSQSSTPKSRRKFDKVIWLNDIVFESNDVLELLGTENGHFDQACGLDFIARGYYDTWVGRTADNQKILQLWPYFSTSSDIGKVIHDSPIEVNSCWNGMAIFDAKWFYANQTSTPSSTSTSVLSSSSTSLTLRKSEAEMVEARSTLPHNSSAPMPPPLPLRFRQSERCYSSECLLVSYDLHRAQRESGGSRPRIFVNPKVKLAYNARDYFLHSKLMRFKIVSPWTLFWQYLLSYRLFNSVTQTMDDDKIRDKCKEYFPLWYPPSSNSPVWI